MDTMSLHATALLIGPKAVLIRGEPGAGKSTLAHELLVHPKLPFTRLIGDDRIVLTRHHARLIAAPHPRLEGLIEQAGHGLLAQPFEAQGVVMLDVFIGETLPDRLPEQASTPYLGLAVPHLSLHRTMPMSAIITTFLRKNMKYPL